LGVKALKILVLVISSKDEPYLLLDKAVKDTWGSEKCDGVEIYYCYGAGDKNNTDALIGNEIYISCEETLANIGLKTLKSFDLLKQKDFSYIFRTNTSSYVCQQKLAKFVDDKSRLNFYCGIVGRYHLNPAIEFCSGAGYFLSRDVFDLVLKHSDSWDHTHLDDVSLGIVLKNLGVPIAPGAKRLTLADIHFEYDKKVLDDHYHIRCASYDKKRTSSNIEYFHMNRIHEILRNNQ
jgi:hypothetical protein